MKIIIILKIFLFIALTSCKTTDEIGYGSQLKVSKGYELLKESNKEKVIVKYPIIIKENTIFDGKNKIFEWSGKGKCNQDEGQLPIFIMFSNSTLKNVYISNSPEGVHIKGQNILIDNIVNLGVCEDAVSTRIRGEFVGIKIFNSTFMNCEDKALQINKGVDVEIVNNKFINCRAPIRVTVADNVKITNNYASGCEHFVTSGPRVKKLSIDSNKFNCNKNYSGDDRSVSDLNYKIVDYYRKKLK